MLREADSKPRRLASVLSKGRERFLDSGTFHSQLLFGQSIAPAPLTRVLDCPGDSEGIWMRADPVRTTPDLGAVWLSDGVRIDPDSPAVTELCGMFSEAGMKLDFPFPERGYLRLNELPDGRFVPPWQLAGESMDRVWPQGADARYWRRWLNETQMILHQYSRSDDNLPGSLWFWGAGELPQTSPASRVNRVRARSPELRGAAAWAGLESFPFDAVADVDSMAGSLLEWPVDHARSAKDQLAELTEYLARAWRRLKFDRGMKALELADETRVRRFSALDAWRPW
jgi:hypothetical protein